MERLTIRAECLPDDPDVQEGTPGSNLGVGLFTKKGIIPVSGRIHGLSQDKRSTKLTEVLNAEENIL
jgi:hypothetical protein